MIIGLVGENGAGKGTIAKYLENEHNFKHVSTGNIVREYTIKLNGSEGDRRLQQKVGIDLRKKHGTRFLVKEALRNNNERLVISGLRHPDEVRAIKATHGVIVYVTASAKNRYKRIKDRDSTRDKLNFKTFLEQESFESGNYDVFAQHLDTVIGMHDVKIVNNAKEDDLYNKVKDFLNDYFPLD